MKGTEHTPLKSTQSRGAWNLVRSCGDDLR